MNVRHYQHGFTLIEVLIAITLLTVGILAAAGMQISALGGNSLASRVTQASTLAGSTIEQLMSLDYDNPLLADTVGGGGLTDPSDASMLTPALNELTGVTVPDQQPDGFEIFWQVAAEYPFVDCKTIRVIVRRTDKGVMRSVAFDAVKIRAL